MSIYDEDSDRSFEKLFKVVENYNTTFLEKCKQKSEHCQQDLLSLKSTITFLEHNLKYLKQEFSKSDPQQKLKKLSSIIPRHVLELESENKNLKKRLEEQTNLNRLYRLGYDLDISVYLSTILWMSSSNYQSICNRDFLIKKFPKEILKIIGNCAGVIWEPMIKTCQLIS